MAFDPSIRWVHMDPLRMKQSAEQTKIDDDLANGKITQTERDRRTDIVKDEGLFAALLNYDAIKATGNYVVLLNRTKVAVQKDNV